MELENPRKSYTNGYTNQKTPPLYTDLCTDENLSIDLHKLININIYTHQKIPPQFEMDNLLVYT